MLARCLCLCSLLLFPVLTATDASGQDRMTLARLAMVRKVIESEGISNERVLEAMRTVPRHEFVRASDRNRAYQDLALAIGHKQTISPPFIVAYMTETLAPERTDRVLEIGTGSGYQAAVLSGLVSNVYTIEIVKPLAESARKRLKALGYDNVHVKAGDGYKGWAEHAPFDRIIVTCSPENIPVPLIEQLREGGRMIIPLGERYQQVFHLLEKKDGELVRKKLIPTLFVPMTGESEDKRQVQPDPMKPQVVNGDFEIDSNDDGRPDNWHYQRQTELVDQGVQRGKRCLRMYNDEPGRLAQLLQGSAISGQHIGSLQVSVWVRSEDVRQGPSNANQAAIVVYFFDAIRRSVASGVIGPIRGSSGWTRYRKTIPVPRNAREMIVRVGLNGATGQLDVDDLQLTARPR